MRQLLVGEGSASIGKLGRKLEHDACPGRGDGARSGRQTQVALRSEAIERQAMHDSGPNASRSDDFCLGFFAAGEGVLVTSVEACLANLVLMLLDEAREFRAEGGQSLPKVCVRGRDADTRFRLIGASASCVGRGGIARDRCHDSNRSAAGCGASVSNEMGRALRRFAERMLACSRDCPGATGCRAERGSRFRRTLRCWPTATSTGRAR